MRIGAVYRPMEGGNFRKIFPKKALYEGAEAFCFRKQGAK